MHFIADIRGYWLQFPDRARMVGWGAGALILLSVIAGFFIMGTPGQVRLYRFDDQKITDLQSIQWQLLNYWQSKGVLPESLEQLNDPLTGTIVPMDPQSGASYKYTKSAALTFSLCATFNAETQPNSPSAPRGTIAAPIYQNVDDLNSEPWTHTAGEQCFERTIDPERYPTSKGK